MTEAILAERFGNRVAAMVRVATDTPRDWDGRRPKAPWRQRKEAYLAHIPEADPALLRPTIADKIDNVRAILADYRREGDAVFERFNAGKADQLWYYRECHKAYLVTAACPGLVAMLGELVASLPAVPVTDGRSKAADPGA